MENMTNTQAQKRRAAAATDQSEEISLTLYNLTEIVKLAAFAAEARRTLARINDVLDCRPKMKEIVRDSVLNSTQWSELEDNTGEVLFYVARQLEKVNGEFTKNVYDLAYPGGGHTEAEKTGGAD